MPARFRNPPIIELIAELQWGPPVTQAGGAIVFSATAAHEDFFMRFALQAGQLGYDRAERLVPPGFPAMPFQVMYRFRKKSPEEGTSLFQVGPGIFSANITPPYGSWAEFRPVVREGVAKLIEARGQSEKEVPFSSVSLRYVDAFGQRFTMGRPMMSFLREELGFSLDLPAALKDEVAEHEEPTASSQIYLPLKSGHQFTVQLAQGLVAGEQAVIMDMTIRQAAEPIVPTAEAAMAVFEAEHEIIHRIFEGMTHRLFALMEPVEEEGP